MSEDYLWERMGSDPEVERLEAALRPLAFDAEGRTLRLPARRRRLPWIPLAAAAVLAAVAGAVRLAGGPGAHFAVEAGDRSFRVVEGAWVEETGTERVIRLGAAGEVRAGAGARVKVVRIGADGHRLRLEFGTLRARIAADVRPRFFQVETPAATCVDLGCAYTLSVDGKGRSLVRVDFGRVAFEDGSREVLVPAEAECAAEPGRGPGSPLFRDAPAEFAAAAAAFDAARGPGRAAAARSLAAMAGRVRDTLTLWHLLQEPDREVRAAALEGLVRLEGPLVDAPPEATLAGDPGAVSAWRSRLERHWY